MQQRASKNGRGSILRATVHGSSVGKLHTTQKLLEINLYLKQCSAQMLNYWPRKTVEM